MPESAKPTAGLMPAVSRDKHYHAANQASSGAAAQTKNPFCISQHHKSRTPLFNLSLFAFTSLAAHCLTPHSTGISKPAVVLAGSRELHRQQRQSPGVEGNTQLYPVTLGAVLIGCKTVLHRRSLIESGSLISNP